MPNDKREHLTRPEGSSNPVFGALCSKKMYLKLILGRRNFMLGNVSIALITSLKVAVAYMEL